MLRFVGALSVRLLLACLPLIAARFGDRRAGLILLFPIMTVSGFLVLGHERGPEGGGRA